MSSKSREVQCYEFIVDGMTCAACELKIEKKLKKIKGTKSVDAILNKNKLKITGDFEEGKEELLEEINDLIEMDGYIASLNKQNKQKKINYRELLVALLIGLPLSILFLLSEIGFAIPDINTGSSTNLPVIFLIGFVASISTCAAVTGSLVLSISTNFVKTDGSKNITPHITFHLARLATFFIGGGILGLIGQSLSLGLIGVIIMNILLGIILLAMAVNLLDLFDFLSVFRNIVPKKIMHRFLEIENSAHWFMPVAAGALTFILPCGFTQATQGIAFSTGTFIGGALTMLVFALGTLPVLGLISFTGIKFGSSSKYSGLFFKTSGIIVLCFAVFTFINAINKIPW